jgi:hypothetical protein
MSSITQQPQVPVQPPTHRKRLPVYAAAAVIAAGGLAAGLTIGLGGGPHPLTLKPAQLVAAVNADGGLQQNGDGTMVTWVPRGNARLAGAPADDGTHETARVTATWDVLTGVAGGSGDSYSVTRTVTVTVDDKTRQITISKLDLSRR